MRQTDDDRSRPTGARVGSTHSARRAKIWAAVLVLALLLLVLVVFLVQNPQRTEVHFLGWEGDASLAVVLLIAAALGCLATAFAVIVSGLRGRFRRSA